MQESPGRETPGQIRCGHGVRQSGTCETLTTVSEALPTVPIPLRRIIPPLGGVDISPIIVLLILQGIKAYLLPMAFAPLMALLG